jgi:hypothetical protein
MSTSVAMIAHKRRRSAINRYIAAALSIAVAVGPASDLDVGLGGKVGGLGADDGLSVGKEGASVGVAAEVDNVGGANIDGSLKTDKGALDAGVAANSELGDISGGLSAGAGPRGVAVGVDANVGGVGESNGGVSPGPNASAGDKLDAARGGHRSIP